ncbi:MAG: hypothetical protein ACK4IC_00515 [Erythrobacter sp.]
MALTLGATVGALAASYLYQRLAWHRLEGGWSPLLAIRVVGTASGLLFALDRQWGYTSRIAEIADGRPSNLLAGYAALR